MAQLNFSSSSFAQEIQENIQNVVKHFHFEKPEEFDIAAHLLTEICEHKQIITSTPAINNKLYEDIKKIEDMLNDYDMYISLQYIKNYPVKFIETDFDTDDETVKEEKISTLLSDLEEATDADIEKAFQDLILTETADQATYLSKIGLEIKNARIQERAIITANADATRETLRNALPPAPGSERCTLTEKFAEILGGTLRYQEVIEKLSETSGLINCADIQGKIDGNYIDAYGLKWSFTLHHQDGSKNNLVVLISNDQSIAPDNENPHHIITAEQAICTFLYANFNYACGPHAISTSSVCDLLHTIIRQRADVAFAYAYAITCDKTEVFNSLLSDFFEQALSREKMIERINTNTRAEAPVISIEQLRQRMFNDGSLEWENIRQPQGLLFNFPRQNSQNASLNSSFDLENSPNLSSIEPLVDDSDEESLDNNAPQNLSMPVYTRESPRRSTRMRRAPNRYQ
ncbi:hypothetical protein CC99x_006160 [Candidatus Berkiella cookevillensis]|uniref:Uncharacterized protein n=1 Tax=Candidatus Berkiella cookevillensis TaxID=437022 RepID=A0A0Q9YH40_9GAMM|nr:hypothetical protein [Candidatus Berkiella cookevillensis]MCS5708489.1 hypothetical protein [Candidatus Berkiella cookevillensis]